jgi:AbrB family looped-hinge helix DNA binding protein
MNATLTIDKAGRVVIPKPLRDQLHLNPGDTLELEAQGEIMTMRPVRLVAPLHKERGVWVYRAGVPLPASVTGETLQAIREVRDRRNTPGGAR